MFGNKNIESFASYRFLPKSCDSSRFLLYYFFSFFLNINLLFAYNSFFNHWHCIGIAEKINFDNPYKAHIGDLPLVLWKNPKNNDLISTINICKHMGSKLDNGLIMENGCLKCQYHGLEISEKDSFGKVKEYDGKLFWSYKPLYKNPFCIPSHNNSNYESSYLEIDMPCSLTDSAYNTMDLRHPEYVHNKLFGFGSNISPENIKYYKYGSNERIGLSFDYSSNERMKILNNNVDKTNNFHMYIYPTFSWSKVNFDTQNLIIGVNLLPLSKKKTRWYITIRSNYYKSFHEKMFLQFLTKNILNQDYDQMKNQYEENDLKKEVLFNHIFNDEEPILELRHMLENYKYPDIKQIVELYKDSKKNY
jgi:phenylpropionate dioxygenase-like ring-hydroxylating dioxygenase large terminal subunit